MDIAAYEFCIKEIVGAFAETVGFVSHQTHSYEHYVQYQIPEIIEENSPLQIFCPKQKVMHVVHMQKVSIGKPTIKEANGFIRLLFPKEAFLRRESYMADVFVDLRHEMYTSLSQKHYKLHEVKIYQHVLLFQFPCMRNSSVCNDHQRLEQVREQGTFIINGFEKSLILQEKQKCNYPFIHTLKRATKYAFRCEIRSCHATKIRSTSTLNIYMSGKKTDCIPTIRVAVPFVKNHIPLIVIFRLLGVADIASILKFIVGTKSSPALVYLARSILCNDQTGTAGLSLEELYDWIGLQGAIEKANRKRVHYVKNVIDGEFLPHCASNGGDINMKKAFFLGYSVRKLMAVYLKEIPEDDIDSYVNKRCATSGSLIALLSRQLIRSFLKTVHVQVFRAANNGKFINITDFFTHRKITSGLKYAFSTGNWGIQKGQNSQSGVCQVLNKMGIAARLSHLRLINTPLNRDGTFFSFLFPGIYIFLYSKTSLSLSGKLSEPRQLHRSHWGILCAAETPEGRSVGLLNSLSTLALVRVGCAIHYVIDILYTEMNVISLQAYREMQSSRHFMVLVNGIIAGFVDNPLQLVRTYQHYRRWHSVPIDSSISYQSHADQICINTDAEDCYRPLICLRHFDKLAQVFQLYCSYPHFLWQRLLVEGVIEYINKEEESELHIVVTYQEYLENQQLPVPVKFTHMELHPSYTVNGISAGTIPFSNHNQAPRNIYQCLYADEPVLLANGRRVPIRDVVVGDKVVTFHPDTLAISFTTVVQQLLMYTKKVVVHVHAAGDRRITVTDDHLFMTDQGWRCARQFDLHTRLATLTDIGAVAFVPIESVSVASESLVADITTASSNHSFVGGRGNFLVHNSAMMKQAISAQQLDFNENLESKSYTLCYPQKPMVTTWTADHIEYSDKPTGQSVVVAFQCLTGYNQEDSVIVSRSALQRGLFRTSVYRTYKDTEATHGADTERFDPCLDSNLTGRHKGDYSKLSHEDGIVPVGTHLVKNDVIIGKTIQFTSVQHKASDVGELEGKYVSERRKRDRSTLLKCSEESRVERVVFASTKDGLRSVSVRTVSFREPEIGDKLSSCHGQKGIIGMILPQEDMPFTLDGVVPDLIVNCHAIPSRMTIGQMIESALGKTACLTGAIANGTPFRGKSVQEIEALLGAHGMNGLSKEVMMDGRTGRQLQHPVFIGVTYYQRLRHMVQDKVHGRSKGPQQILTRQPVEGRSRRGGLRLGEMERDSLLSHGVSGVIIDRLLKQSDYFETVICESCGQIAESAAPKDIHEQNLLPKKAYCRNCQSHDKIADVKLPYCMKLLAQELQACHVALKFCFDDK